MRINNVLNKAIYYFLGLSLGVIWILIMLSKSINYAVKIPYNTFLLSIFGILIVTGIIYCIHKFNFNLNLRAVFLVGFLFLIFQIFLVRVYYFMTDWDVQTIIETAKLVAKGQEATETLEYFSHYPNNLFLTYIFSLIFRICYSVGISENNAYFVILILQCVISYISGVLTYYVTCRLTKSNKIAMTVYVIYLLLIGLSPWTSIPYSDSIVLFLPIAIIAIYLSEPKSKFSVVIKWVSIGLITYLGYEIKPTVFITFIAIIIVEIPKILDKLQRKTFVRQVASALLGILIGLGISNAAIHDLDLKINPESRYGMMHFLAMGLNEQDMGIWSQIHVDYSSNFKTIKERDAADLNLAKEMIQDMGLGRLIKQYGRKLLTNFNDGSFAWANEGIFFYKIFPRDDSISLFVRSFYYREETRFHIFLNFEHAIWLAVLFFAFCSVLGRRDTDCSAIMLTLIGYIIYGMIFEARARYTFSFVPLFLVLAGMGIPTVKEMVKKIGIVAHDYTP